MKPTKMKARIAQLEKELESAKAESKSWSDKWIESERAKGSAMADGFERKKLEKTIKVIGLIAAGKSNEAILQILEPMPVLFTMNVAFADEGTKERAEDETLERLKKLLFEAMNNVKVKRGKRWVAEQKDGQIVAEYKDQA